jgi:hypothetical protein
MSETKTLMIAGYPMKMVVASDDDLIWHMLRKAHSNPGHRGRIARVCNIGHERSELFLCAPKRLSHRNDDNKGSP